MRNFIISIIKSSFNCYKYDEKTVYQKFFLKIEKNFIEHYIAIKFFNFTIIKLKKTPHIEISLFNFTIYKNRFWYKYFATKISSKHYDCIIVLLFPPSGELFYIINNINILKNIFYYKNIAIFYTNERELRIIDVFLNLKNIDILRLDDNIAHFCHSNLNIENIKINNCDVYFTFSTWHYLVQDREINTKNNRKHFVHFINKAMNIDDKIISYKYNFYISNYLSLKEKCTIEYFTLNNFIVLCPEATTCSQYHIYFWILIAKLFKNKGYTVFVNTLKNNNFIPDSYAFHLDYSEFIIFCKKAKYIVSLRSGLCDIISFINTKHFILYTDIPERFPLKKIPSENALYGFSLSLYNKNIIEFDTNKNTIHFIINQIMQHVKYK